MVQVPDNVKALSWLATFAIMFGGRSGSSPKLSAVLLKIRDFFFGPLSSSGSRYLYSRRS